MHKNPRVWIVVADSARVRLFMTDEDETRLIARDFADFTPTVVSPYARDVTSDRPGRSIGSMGGGVRHAIEPHHDYHKQEKRKFVVELAQAIDRSFAAKEYDRLILLAPPRTLGELRRVLSLSVQASMNVIAKDLTKAPQEMIWSEVAELIHHRPVAS